MVQKNKQFDLFFPTIIRPPLRDLADVMEVCCLSLSKKRRLKPIQYHNGKISVLVTANATYGMATVWDWDVIIGLVSLINESKNEGLRIGRHIAFVPYHLLDCIGRDKSGGNYHQLAAAIHRLRFTGITTNVRLDDQHGEERPFSFVEDYRISERYSIRGLSGASASGPDSCKPWEVIISSWVYNAVVGQKGILSIDRVYLSLTGGIEKFLFRYARKAVPEKPGHWRIGMMKLYAKSSSCGDAHDFSRKLREIASKGSLPGYRLEVVGKGKAAMVWFYIDKNRGPEDRHKRSVPRSDIEAELEDFIPY